VPTDGKRSDMSYIQGRATDPNAAPSAAGGGRGGAPGAGGPPAASSGPAASGAPGAAGAPAAGGGRGAGAGGEGGGGLTIQGLPLVKPPYGRITAIDLNKGEIVWQIPHGETPDNIRNHAALKGVTIPRTGRPGRIGTLVTKT